MIAFARRLRLRTLLVAALLFAAAPAAALGTDEATAFIDSIAERATTVLSGDEPRDERRAELREILRSGFDLDYIGRLVLGPNYRSLSAEQQRAYDETFQEFVLDTYSRRIGDYGGEELEIVGAEPAGSQDVKVATRVVGTPDGEPVRLTWRVRERESGPKIVDVEVEGVSMAISQRSEFASIVEQRGVDGLIEMLRERRIEPPS